MFISFEAAFDFALQLTGSMGNLRTELERQPLPGLATAFKPAVPGRGLLSLVELSVKTLGHRKGQQSVNICAPVPVLAEDQVHTSPQTSVISRPLLINNHSCSMDSGFDDSETISRSSTPCYSRQSLSETNSGSSLVTYMPEEQGTQTKRQSIPRSQTEPKLHHKNSLTECQPSLREILMEAVLIIEEAEIKETTFSQSDE